MPDVSVEPAESETGTVSALAKTSARYGNAAVVTFNSSGDSFSIQDTAADDHSAVAQVSGHGYYWNPNGAGSSKSFTINFAEGITIKFRACVGEHATKKILHCGDWKTANTAG
ncbi:hypothetical protein [Cystobacter fuscus]|uniref:hypothetical protein n=1 Tax=Cystobacter fuscus TaxID=43 RepID=UPI002B2BEA6A|nr:hypothetical protein F0U63_40615 [Cystobacter fuscus]